jgi:hypothetical protein
LVEFFNDKKNKMETVNQQLNIVPTPRNSNYRSKMARGAMNYQVQLGTEDPSLDYYNDIRAIESYKNADGWDGDRDLGSEAMIAEEEYTEFSGGYPLCMTALCRKCKNECKVTQGLHWRNDGGKECFKTCKVREKDAQMDRIQQMQGGGGSSQAVKSGEIIPQEEQAPAGTGMGTKIAIGIAVVAVVGVAIYMIRKKKS